MLIDWSDDGLIQFSLSKTLKTLNVRPLSGLYSPEFLSRVIPKPVEITDLLLIKETNTESLLNQLYDQGFVSDEMEKMSEDLKNPMFTLRLDGFLEVNKLQAKSVLDRTKLLLEGNGNIQKVFMFESGVPTDDKTNFNLIIVI